MAFKHAMFEPEHEYNLTVIKFNRDTVFQFGNMYKPVKGTSRSAGNRGEITEFSYTARRRLKLYMRNVIGDCCSAVHLTYPSEYPLDGEVVKKHLQRLRMVFNRRKIRFLWLMEFQRRGAPHFHIITDRHIPMKWLAETWYRIIESKDERSLRAGTRVEAIHDRKDRDRQVNYFVAYLTKAYQKHVPDDYKNVGRFWGLTRNWLLRTIHHFACADIRSLQALTRQDRRWYVAHLREWGINNWKWGGRGFLAWDHGDYVKQCEENWKNENAKVRSFCTANNL